MDVFFIGSAISPVGVGGEIMLPPAFVRTLKNRSDKGEIYVGRHEEGQCLVGYDRLFLDQQMQRVDWGQGALVGGSRMTHDAWLRRTFAFVEPTVLTDKNHMSIGPILRARGKIGAAVLLVGAGQRFEIWDLASVIARGPCDLQWVAERHVQAQRLCLPAGQNVQAALAPVVLPPAKPRKASRTVRRPGSPRIAPREQAAG